MADIEQVDRLKAGGDVTGLVEFFLEQRKAPPDPRTGGDVRIAKEAAAHALAELGTDDAMDALAGLMESGPRDRMVADALAEFEDPRAVEILIRMTRDHNDAGVREAAAGALAGHTDPVAARRDEVLDALLTGLKDREFGVRWNIAYQLTVALRLRKVGEDDRVVELLQRALADEHVRVREQAAQGLRAMEDPRAAEALRALLTDPEEGVRRIAEDAPGVLQPEVRALAEAKGWPELGVGGSPASGLVGGALGGAIFGLAILVLLTRGDFEGVLVLLGGGGGGVGLIIMAVTVLGVAAWGFILAKSKVVKAGPASWDRWLASAGIDDLKKAKAELES